MYLRNLPDLRFLHKVRKQQLLSSPLAKINKEIILIRLNISTINSSVLLL